MKDEFREASINDLSADDREYIKELFGNDHIVGYYADEERLESLPSADSYTCDEIENYLKGYLRFFSREELDLIYMNFIGGKTQVDLQEFFRKTQPAICSDSNRIKETIGMVKVLNRSVEKVLDFLCDDNNWLSYADRNVLLVFFYTASIARTAQVIGINAMLCRSRIETAIGGLRGKGKKYEEIHDYFQYILKNLNRLKKEVSESAVTERPAKYDYPSGYLSQEFDFN